MMEKDRVKPTHYEFGLMITLLGKVGYVQKAFNLFYKVRNLDFTMKILSYQTDCSVQMPTCDKFQRGFREIFLSFQGDLWKMYRTYKND